MALKIQMHGSDMYATGYDNATGEQGTLKRFVNGTGAVSVKGSVLSASETEDRKVALEQDEFDAITICAESGIANGDLVWCWEIGSTCQILWEDGETSTHGYIAICADTNGRAKNIAVPSANPVVAEHFKEIGHVFESKASGTNVLVLCETHYN